MRFGSVCSGIEAASVAWEPLGWKAAWLAEIEPFPSAVLAHHYPEVPNLGDMTTLPARIRLGEVEAPDLFCGGTPCQAFSVAGLRRSLDDARGNLSLTFCEIADAIDSVRRSAGMAASIIFWENVPGVLNTKDNAFGCFLAGLAGEDEPLVAPGKKWADAGCVFGPQRAVAWRVLDAQYFGLAQRRRRVFVVASARDGFDPAAVLFEWEGVRRDSAPSREAGKVAPTIPARSTSGGGCGTDFDCDGGVIQQPYPVANCLTARMHKGINTTLDEGQTPVVQSVPMINMQGSKGNAVAQADGPSFTLNAMHGHDVHAIAVPVGITLHGTDGTASVASLTDLSSSLRARIPSGVENSTTTAVMQPVAFAETAPTLSVGAHGAAGHPHRQHGNETAIIGMQPVALQDITGREKAQNGRGWNDDGTAYTVDTHATQGVAVAVPDVAGTMKACKDSGGWSNSADHAAAGYMVPVAFHPTQDPISSSDVCHAIGTGNGQGCATAAVAVDTYNCAITGDLAAAITSRQGIPDATGPRLMQAMQVRRLTPTECSRLQGFPDDYLELIYADANEAHAAQILHELWKEVGAAAFEKQEWGTGISASLLTPEILLAGVYGGWIPWQMAAECAAASRSIQSENACSEEFVRTLRGAGASGCSPYQRQSFRQLADKLGSDLSLLPLEGAQARKALRSHRLWPQAQKKWSLRYAFAAPEKRDRLERLNPDGPRYKALGNSWAVPVVRWIGRRIAAATSPHPSSSRTS